MATMLVEERLALSGGVERCESWSLSMYILSFGLVHLSSHFFVHCVLCMRFEQAFNTCLVVILIYLILICIWLVDIII